MTVTTALEKLRHISDALIEPEMVIDLFFENAFYPIIVINHEGIIQNVNKQAQAMFGYRRSEMYDQPVEMLMPDNVHERHRGHVASFMQEPRVREMGAGMQLLARHKSGREFHVEIGLSWTVGDKGVIGAATIRKKE